MYAAIVENGVVVNTILAENPSDFGAIPCDGTVSIGWTYDGDNFSAPAVDPVDPNPEPYIPSTPSLIATALVSIDDGMISSVSVSARLAGVFQFSPGEYWAFFTEEQPDTNYMVLAYDSGTHRVSVAVPEKQTSHFIIRATDLDGTPSDPACINVEVKRVI